MHVFRIRCLLALCVALSLIAACGGGNDSTGASTTPPAAPTVAAPAGLTYATPSVATIGVAVSLTPTVAGGAVASYSVVPALPSGVAINSTTGVISGTPLVLADPALYNVTAANAGGSSVFVLQLRVAPPVASKYVQTNLTSNGAIAGTKVDARLVNPWGIAWSATSPVWVSNAGTQTSTLYDGTGTALATVVAIPPGTNGAGGPTGIIANATTQFLVTKATASAAARFIFASLAGTISGWAPTVDAANAITTYDDGAGGAVYTGLTFAVNGTANTLYAADFKHGKIDVFNGTWQKITPTGTFVDPLLPAGYAAFNVQAIRIAATSYLVVTYAQKAANGREAVAPGLGVVDIFDLNGSLLRRLASPGGRLSAPWGVAMTPANFGSYSNLLLIGNFGDGTISAYDPTSGVFAGTLSDANGTPLANVGLWGIGFGNGAQQQPVNTLYFAAGISGETAGLYGRIDLAP